MELLETELVQRAFDNKWERIGKIIDYENSYTYFDENGLQTTLIPTKWITLNVYDFIMEEVE